MPLLDDGPQAIGVRHYSYQTKLTYLGRLGRFVQFHKRAGG